MLVHVCSCVCLIPLVLYSESLLVLLITSLERFYHHRWLTKCFEAKQWTNAQNAYEVLPSLAGSEHRRPASIHLTLLYWCRKTHSTIFGRAVPKDQALTFDTKHRGGKFSHVVRTDPSYVEWAIEHQSCRGLVEEICMSSTSLDYPYVAL